jgi:SAM-dependent methyltransferase
MSEADIRAKYQAIADLGTTRSRYRKKPASRLDARARRIRKLLSKCGFAPDPGKRILDVGGAWGYCILPFVGQCRLHLVDYEKWDLDPGIEYLGRSISDVPEAEKFDCILFLHTLEHVPDPQRALNDLAGHLTDDGFLYVEVPLGVFWEMTRLQEPITHVNFFSEESLFNLARSSGLHVTSLSTDFQWVTSSRQWCVNMVVSKKARPSDKRDAKRATRQRHGWGYFALAVLNRMARKLGVDT